MEEEGELDGGHGHVVASVAPPKHLIRTMRTCQLVVWTEDEETWAFAVLATYMDEILHFWDCQESKVASQAMLNDCDEREISIGS